MKFLTGNHHILHLLGVTKYKVYAINSLYRDKLSIFCKLPTEIYKIMGTSKNPDFVTMPRYLQKMLPYISANMLRHHFLLAPRFVYNFEFLEAP